MPYKDPEARRAYQRVWQEANREKVRAANRASMRKYRDVRREAARAYQEAHREERRARAQVYWQENRERLLARWQEYYAAHVEERRVYRHAYYEANKEKTQATVQAYRAANPEVRQAEKARRRQREVAGMSAQDRADAVEWRRLIRDDLCFYCRASKTHHVDHYTALANGGTDHWWNLVRACRDCNLRKGSLNGDEFIALSGRVWPSRLRGHDYTGQRAGLLPGQHAAARRARGLQPGLRTRGLRPSGRAGPCPAARLGAELRRRRALFPTFFDPLSGFVGNIPR